MLLSLLFSLSLFLSLSYDSHLRIADFGSCTVEPAVVSLEEVTSLPKPAHRQSLAIGTPEYTPPEILHGKVYTMAADAWGIGCVMYQVCTHTHTHTHTHKHADSTSANQQRSFLHV